jgi:GYD domain
VIVDLPDNASAAAVAAAVWSSGALSSLETVVLLTPSEVDEAMKKAVSYRPPGG